MSLRGWSVEEDACLIYFLSKGVVWQGCADILYILCHTNRSVNTVHTRAAWIAADGLFSYEDQQWDQARVWAYIASLNVGRFHHRLLFTGRVLQAIGKVSELTVDQKDGH